MLTASLILILFGQAEAALAEARLEAIKKYKAARFGPPVVLSEKSQKTVDVARLKLSSREAAIVTRMIDGERPIELSSIVYIMDPRQLEPGDFGPIQEVYQLDSIFDDQTAFCSFKSPPVRFILRAPTAKLLIDRAYSFRGDVVLIRKSDDLADEEFEKGVLVVEFASPALVDLMNIIHPPKSARSKLRRK